VAGRCPVHDIILRDFDTIDRRADFGVSVHFGIVNLSKIDQARRKARPKPDGGCLAPRVASDPGDADHEQMSREWARFRARRKMTSENDL
jgi:hypothetical protein